MLEIVEFAVVLLPCIIYMGYAVYYYTTKLSEMNVIVTENERLPASLLVKADCFVAVAVTNIGCMILSRVLSASVIWQSEYPSVALFYLVDAVTWLLTVKICKLEFEREIGTCMASRLFWVLSFSVAAGRMINPW